MDRSILVKELASFLFIYGIFGREIEESTIKSNIESSLEKVDFVESLINKLNIEARKRKYIDIEKLKELLLELERIRIDLDFKDFNKKSK